MFGPYQDSNKMNNNNNILKTYTSSLKTLRMHAVNDVTLVDIATKGDFGNKPSNAVKVNDDRDSSYTNAIQIQFVGDVDGTTFTWLLYGWRKNNGMANLMCKGTGIVGPMKVVVIPSTIGDFLGGNVGDDSVFEYADTLVITENNFVKPFNVTDSGNGGAAILSGDLCGFTDLYLEIQDSTPNVGGISAFFAGW